MNKISAVIVLLLLVISCEGNKTIDGIFDSVERGAILRTVAVSGNTFNVLDTSSEWSVEVEESDYENGGLLQEVELYGSLVDNTPEGGTTDVDEALIKTIPASAFSAGSSGLPRGTISTSFQEALDALGLASGEYDGGDQIILRLELVLTDGRTFTDSNTASTVSGGSFFSSPFRYTNLLICELPIVPAGDWVIDMHDSYGDGWQTETSGGGAGITVTLNTGEVFEVGLCTPYQASEFDCIAEDFDGSDTITIPADITSAEWYFPGDFWGEISFEIYAPSGNLVAAYSAGSPAGSIALNLCNE